MTGGEWPPLVPDPPGQEGKLPAIVPKIPSTNQKPLGSKDMSPRKKVVALEAGSLNSAYRQLEKHRLQPVPTGSESLCEKTPNMKVVQDNVEMDWNLMRVAVPMTKDKVVEGINKEDKALDGPVVSSRHRTSAHEQKAVTMVKKRRRKRMTSPRRKLLENRSIFCGPMKKKKTKRSRPNKSKADQKAAQEAAVHPKVHL